jgi:hypothetical protein
MASSKGWKPKEEYDGDADAWVDAEEFIKRQPFIDRIRKQSKRMKELEKAVDALSKHYKVNLEKAKEKAIAELKLRRKGAIELGEADEVEQLDSEIEEINSIQAPEPPKDHVLPDEIIQFMEDNKAWFQVDNEMTAFAVAFNENYLRSNPGKLEESLAKTLKAVKNAFPDRFANQKKTLPPAVDGGGNVGGNKSQNKYSVSRLSTEQKIVYEHLVKRSKQLTHDEYFKGLEEAGFLEA